MNINIITLGCKVNKYESQAMLEYLLKNGYKSCDTPNEADIIIINSCTVTSISDQKTRKILHKIKRENKKAIVILTGCVPQAFPNKINDFTQADIIMGNSNRLKLIENINKFIEQKKQIVDIEPYSNKTKFENISISKFGERTRAFLKIQDGCNQFCSYCMIPFARGRIRSKKLEDIKNEVISLEEAGYKEIVLTGINLSAYGEDLGLDLCDAVKEVCSHSKIERVRLSSLEADKMNINFIERLAENKKLCDHFHLSLQSGCDETLKRMNRNYDTKLFRELVNKLRELFNNCSITTDVIVGFPGETEDEFIKSFEFIKSINFAKIHTFPYSHREGTKAANYENKVPTQIKKLRASKLRDYGNICSQNFIKKQIGSVCSVLIETECNKGLWEGFSTNYTRVIVKSCSNLKGKILKVKLTDYNNKGCIGEII